MGELWSARSELDGGGSCLRGPHEIDILSAVAAVLTAIGRINLVIEDMIGLLEKYILIDASGLVMALVTDLSAAEPSSVVPISGTDIKVVFVTDDPDCHRLAQHTGTPEGCDLEFV